MAARAGIIAMVARTARIAEEFAIASIASRRIRASLDCARRSMTWGGMMLHIPAPASVEVSVFIIIFRFLLFSAILKFPIDQLELQKSAISNASDNMRCIRRKFDRCIINRKQKRILLDTSGVSKDSRVIHNSCRLVLPTDRGIQ